MRQLIHNRPRLSKTAKFPNFGNMRKPPIHQSFYNAFRGIFVMLASERNFQIEFAALLINLVLIVLLKVEPLEAAVIVLTCAAVLSAEILNTAAEKICDIIQPEYDERIKFIKDVSAGAVLILTVASLMVGVVVYYPYL